MESIGFPAEVIVGIKDSIDCNLYFGKTAVPLAGMAAILTGSILLFTGLFVAFHLLSDRKSR